jgi:hypothetical protein
MLDFIKKLLFLCICAGRFLMQIKLINFSVSIHLLFENTGQHLQFMSYYSVTQTTILIPALNQTLTTQVFWVVTLCHLVSGSQRFEGLQCLQRPVLGNP